MTRKLTKQERVVERIALLLLSLEPDERQPDCTYEIASGEAALMAYRANRATTDSSWWEVAGKPDWNKRMSRIRRKIEGKI